MAKQTRADRRARREASAGEPALAGAAGTGGTGRSEPPVRVAPEPPARPERERGNPFLNFLRECVAELRKVDWPNQNQVVQGTVVVIVACVIIGAYLYVCDRAFQRLVEQVFL